MELCLFFTEQLAGCESRKLPGADSPTTGLVDWSATLRAAFARNHPYSVTALEAGWATATGYLLKSAYASTLVERKLEVLTGMVVMPSS